MLLFLENRKGTCGCCFALIYFAVILFLINNLCYYRLDRPKKEASSVSQEDMRPVKSEGYGNASEIENFLAKSSIKVD